MPEALTFLKLKKGYIVTFDQQDILTVNDYEIKQLPARTIMTRKTLDEILEFYKVFFRDARYHGSNF